MAHEAESIFTYHWRAFLSGGLLSLTRLAAGFARAKYVALMLGTTGVGFLSQATQLQLLGASLGSLSIAVGIINRMGAIGPGDPEREGRLLATAFTAQMAVSVTLVVTAAIFARPLIDIVFGAETVARSPVSSLDILAVVFSIPMVVVASGFLEAIFFGGGRYDLYVRASIWATILGFIAALSIIAFWRLPGAFWSFFASGALLLSAFLFHVRRVRPLGSLFRFGFSPSEANALFRFSIAVLVSGALVPAGRLWVQRNVIGSFGIDANGLLSVPFAVTAYYTPFLTSALWGRMHPAVTHFGQTREGRRELTTALRLTVGMAAAAIVAILFLKDILVPLAYSRAFVPATRLLPAQLLGDYFYFIGLPFTVYTLGISRLRVYLAVWVSYTAVAVAASFVLLPIVGLVGVPLGYGISNVIGAFAALAWLVARREEGLATTLALIAAGFIVVAAQSYLAWRDEYAIVQGCIVAAATTAVVITLWRARSA